MRKVHEVSELTGVSVRALQYYDKIGLLCPSEHSAAGYRLYADADLEKLQQILLFRELEFPLKEIKQIINDPCFDNDKALEQQIELLLLKKEHIDELIGLARRIKLKGVTTLDFSAFDSSKLEEYSARAKASWGQTPEYKEFEVKDSGRTPGEKQDLLDRLMGVFIDFGTIKDHAPDSDEAQQLVKKLQEFISEHFYNCSDQVLAGLGKMYGCGGEFTQNINAAAGEGTAEFASAAIAVYCGG